MWTALRRSGRVAAVSPPAGVSRHVPSRRAVLLGTGYICLLLALGSVALLLLARMAIDSGLNEMHHAEAEVRTSALKQSPRLALGSTLIYVSRAHDDFGRAHAELAPLAPILQRLRWLPRIGEELAASPDASRLGEQATAGTMPLLRGLQPAAALFGNGSGHRPSIAVLLARVAAGHSNFDRSCSSLRDAQQTRRSLQGFSSDAVTSRLHTFDRQLPRLLGLCRGLALLPELLGYRHPATYLVAYQDPAFLRPTGGFIGSVGLITVRDGKVEQRFLGTGINDNLSVPPPEPVALYNREPAWLLRDANWSPDFPTSADLERYFFKLDLGWQAPGLIDLTPQAAADIASATGPIYVPEYRRWVNGGNIVGLADYYVHYAAGNRPDLRSDTARKQFLPIVARHLFARLESLSADQLVRLVDNLSNAIDHRDILMNSTRPAEQALVRLIGADGEVNRSTSDYLYVVDTNLSYNRINPLVHLQTSYRVQILPTRWLQADLTLRFRDSARGPAASDWYGPGAGKLGGPNDYADFVRVYVPAGGALVGQSGWTQPWTPGLAYGKMMFCGYVIVRSGETRTLHLRYVVPPNVFAWSGGNRYRLVVQHQPGSGVDRLTVAVSHDGRTSSWVVAHPADDWSRTVAVQSRPFQSIPLPRAPESKVAPGHWVEPHAFLAGPRGRSSR